MNHGIILFCLISFIAPGIASADWIRFASWNIEKLGTSEDESALIALAEHLHLTGVDVIVMQEIYDNDNNTATRTNSQLDETFRILNEETGQDWTYEIFPNRHSGDTSQLVAAAWNRSRLNKVDETYRLQFERSANEWDRHPHAIKFSAGADKTNIVVVGIHMKADFRGDFSEQRAKESKILVEALPAIQSNFDDYDVIFAGDFNSKTNNELAIKQLQQIEYRDLNEKDKETHVKYGALDRIIVPTPGVHDSASEFSFSKQYILTAADSAAFDEHLSDHLMIITPIRILEDDD